MAENRLLRSLGYLVGGIALGAATGVLFAPKAGKETRQDLAAWLKKKRERTQELAQKVRETIPTKKEAVVAAFRAGKEAFQEAGNHKKEAVHA